MLGRCQAMCSTHGQPCRAPAIGEHDGKRYCGRHLIWIPRRITGNGDQRLEQVDELLTQAMQHQEWSSVPGPIRHLIEHAWVTLGRAQGDAA